MIDFVPAEYFSPIIEKIAVFFIWDRLIPEFQNSCRSIFIPKIRVKNINSAVDDANDDPFASKGKGGILDRGYTGDARAEGNKRVSPQKVNS
mgnify:CR=1 FL=1